MKCFHICLGAVLLLLPACETARDAASDAGGMAGHAVAKTGHAIEHGGEKLTNATE